MSSVTNTTPREGRELFEATRPFAQESLVKSWWCTISTLLLLAAALTAAALLPWWPARLVFSVLGGLLLVRGFVIYHDFMHDAILRKSRLGWWIFHLYGLAVLTPPRSWRHSHNQHHAHVVKPVPNPEGVFGYLTSEVGAIPLMTTDAWRLATPWQRFAYRVKRHPLTILFAYVTVFLFSICLAPMCKQPRRFWDGALSLALHSAILATAWVFGGFWLTFFAFLLPFTIAAAAGAYVFFAQHNYEGLLVLEPSRWSHYRAALVSSSYLKLGWLMNWFTANIGYHHVHHLNAQIPFYRLPEAMAAIPELQQPVITTFAPWDMWSCFRLCLWDANARQLVTYRQARGR